MAKKQRFKNIPRTTYVCDDPYSPGTCYEVEDGYIEVPLIDWEFSQKKLSPPSWSIGSPAPRNLSFEVQFPELEYLYGNYKSFAFRPRKVLSGTDFIRVGSDQMNPNRRVFESHLQGKKARVQIVFTDLENLSPGEHTITIVMDAFGINGQGQEVPLENSAEAQDVSVTLHFRVLAGTGFNTDKNAYKITYNKSDNTLSGDAQIIVYTNEEITHRTDADFISLTKTAGDATQNLVFTKNASITGKDLGTYRGSVVITQGTRTKSVSVELEVIEDRTQFYISPDSIALTAQQDLGEQKIGRVSLSNPNNLMIHTVIKPSFVERIEILQSEIVITTTASNKLTAGDYSADIVLQAGGVQKRIRISLSVSRNIQHPFKEKGYYFALDPNRVVLQKTVPRASYVRMVLDMYFKGYGEEHLEKQSYDIPFFKNQVEFFPGKEVQDFFVRCRELSAVAEYQYLMNLALVSIAFEYRSEQDETLSVVRLDNLFFAPGRRPQCYPFFTNYPKRRIYEGAEFHLTLDSSNIDKKISDIQRLYTATLPTQVESNSLYRYRFMRRLFHQKFKDRELRIGALSFVPFPEKREGILIEWETENLVFDSFYVPHHYQRRDDIEAIIGASKYYREEKFDNEYQSQLTINTGWILREEIPMITDILRSRLCFITIAGERIKAYPMGKKNEMENSEENLYQMDMEFRILRDEN